ncbi:unnamed protein product [Spirodela intermedia]|uniref:Uncharacterized protein n=1 Tax=Spirodela intermedia TaxID=51605 RepID=A0A7I8JP67_SPIIN|nr:unnamed protein product [Spirodela intermedia]CAA6671561.1 unnamed protein product [Spirodela intermedia]
MERSQIFVKLPGRRDPLRFQRLVSGLREIRDETLISASEDGIFPSCSLLLRLRGGKGGFGSLLRGAATKAGQKKTNNFDACRDMSGRRLRHVNAEKKLEEWKAEAEDRKMEKLAEQFLKSKAKEVKKSSSAVVEKYIEKYKEDSARCMEEVEESVRQSFELYEKSKRKVLPSSGPALKRLKIWMGKKKVDESESEDDEEDDDDAEKSVVLNGGNKNEDDAGLFATSSSQSDLEGSDGGSGKSNLEEEDSVPNQKCLDVSEGPVNENVCSDDSAEPVRTSFEEYGDQTENVSRPATSQGSDKVHLEERLVGDQIVDQKQIDAEERMSLSPEVSPDSPEKNLDVSCAVIGDSVDEKSNEPLNFEEFNSAEELEVLGMERLKSELQAHGLKCGGTLQERAARLFLLKSTPVDKLPKKLLAKPTK